MGPPSIRKWFVFSSAKKCYYSNTSFIHYIVYYTLDILAEVSLPGPILQSYYAAILRMRLMKSMDRRRVTGIFFLAWLGLNPCRLLKSAGLSVDYVCEEKNSGKSKVDQADSS